MAILVNRVTKRGPTIYLNFLLPVGPEKNPQRTWTNYHILLREHISMHKSYSLETWHWHLLLNISPPVLSYNNTYLIITKYSPYPTLVVHRNNVYTVPVSTSTCMDTWSVAVLIAPSTNTSTYPRSASIEPSGNMSKVARSLRAATARTANGPKDPPNP